MIAAAHRRRRVTAPTSRSPLRGDRGSVLPVAAVCLSVITICTALTVDLGRVSARARDVQNVADAAALDLVRLVDGRTTGEVLGDGRWDQVLAASLTRNGFARDADSTVVAQVGAYDPSTDAFVASPAGDDIPAAVKVTVTDRVTYRFAPGGASTSRSAVAARQASAGIQLGSFAARLDSSESALLGPLLGDALGVTAVGYEGLAGARIGLGDLAGELDLSLGSPEQLLTTQVQLVEVVRAQAEVLRRAGDVARAQVLDAIALGVPASAGDLALGDLLTLGAGGADAAAGASLDVLELLTAAALVANGSQAIALPGIDLGVPGVAASNVQAEVVEGARIGFGGPGTTVSTAQVRLSTRLDLIAVGLVGAHVDVTVEAAPSEAVIRAVSCGSPQRLDLDVTTGLVETDASVQARIAVNVPGLANVTVAEAGAETSAGRDGEVLPVDFAFPPDVLGEGRPASSSSLGLGSLTLTPTASLLPDLPLAVRLVLGAVTSTVTGIVGTTLAPLVATALGAVDTVVVRPLLSLLGVTLPGADVTPLSVRCTGPRLVA